MLFSRHKLQRGLLGGQGPKEDRMDSMSQVLKILEGYKNLNVGIIRETKIATALKLILKLDIIPKEEVYQFKARSRALLDHWGRPASEQIKTQPSPAKANGTTNGKDKRKRMSVEFLEMANAKKPENCVRCPWPSLMCDITNFYQSNTRNNIKSETELGQNKVRGSGNRGNSKTAHRSRRRATPKEMKTTRKVAG